MKIKYREIEGDYLRKSLLLKAFRNKNLLFLVVFFFVLTPPDPEYPPSSPLDLITLWQGTFGEYGFFAHALATALEECGLLIPIATCL